jgi:outer membrane protein
VNNNTSLIWNVVLTVALAVLYFLHFSGSKSGAGSTDSSELGGRRIVYVQVDSLLTNYEFFKDTKKELENKRFQLENDLTTKGRSLENEIAFFQQRAQTMTLDQARSTEQQLMKKQQDLVQYRDRSAQMLAQEEATKNELLYKQIQDYIKKYNDDNQYEYVLGYTQGGGILYADSTLNVTQKMIQGLNKAYTSKNSGATAKKDSVAKK